jgi:uncharacterized membrane protein YcaP (DUF421 family)
MPSLSALLEIVGRVVVIYVVLLAMLRVSGRRELAEMGPMDLLTMLLISETVSPALTANDTTVAGSLVAAGTLVLLAVVSSKLAFRSKLARQVIEGSPAVLISHGKVHEDVLRRERITHDELTAKLHENGVMSVDSVQYAFIETDGDITIIKKSQR